MRLTQEQKDAVLASRPGSSLLKVQGQWAVIWKDNSAHPRLRWHGQLLHAVETYFDRDDCALELRVWWYGAEQISGTQRAVFSALGVELAT